MLLQYPQTSEGDKSMLSNGVFFCEESVKQCDWRQPEERYSTARNGGSAFLAACDDVCSSK